MIETVTQKNLEEVLPLIKKYQEFYKVSEISEERNRDFFSQFGPDSDFGCQFLYRLDTRVVGFATVYFSYTSTITSKVAVLNDLYTLPEARRNGVARGLLQHCRNYARAKDAARLQWLTAADNEIAHSLYDAIGADRSTWYFYAKSV